jgi:fatty acid amide hydrolase
MYSFGSSNPVYGTTTNPYDKTRSPGGSSSGEGALIASRGSILGLGTDVGGSLRIPAAFCGITSLKPTAGRIFEGGRRTGVSFRY